MFPSLEDSLVYIKMSRKARERTRLGTASWLFIVKLLAWILIVVLIKKSHASLLVADTTLKKRVRKGNFAIAFARRRVFLNFKLHSTSKKRRNYSNIANHGRTWRCAPFQSIRCDHHVIPLHACRTLWNINTGIITLTNMPDANATYKGNWTSLSSITICSALTDSSNAPIGLRTWWYYYCETICDY